MKLRHSFLLLPLLVGCAAQLHADSVASLSKDSSVDEILSALHAAGKDLRTFSADVVMSELDPALGLGFSRVGRVWIDVKPDGDTRFHAVFTEKKTDTKTVQEKKEYLLVDGKLIDRDYSASPRVQVTRQVLRPGEKLNLLKLGEGPFPLPIGQDPAEVKKQFEVKRMDSSKDDPANTTRIQLTPNRGTSLANKFKTLDVYVDNSTGLPKRIETLDPNETTLRQTDLANVKVNAGVTDADFKMVEIDPKDWQIPPVEEFQR